MIVFLNIGEIDDKSYNILIIPIHCNEYLNTTVSSGGGKNGQDSIIGRNGFRSTKRNR